MWVGHLNEYLIKKKKHVNNQIGVVYIHKQYIYCSQLAFLWSGRGGLSNDLLLATLCSQSKNTTLGFQY